MTYTDIEIFCSYSQIDKSSPLKMKCSGLLVKFSDSKLTTVSDFDGVHLHPGYVHLLEKTMNKGRSSQPPKATQT